MGLRTSNSSRRFVLGCLTVGRRLILAALMVLVVGVATAADTAAQLLENCKDALANNETAGAGVCLGFVGGTWEAANMVNAIRRFDPNCFELPSYCIPNGVTLGQMVQVVVKYIKQHPENLHNKASIVSLNAMRTAWPCPAVAK